MKKTQEFTGKDVTAAVKAACSALGVSKTDLKYDVISTGTSGIFGIVGRKDARIKVTLPEKQESTTPEEMEGIRSMVDEAFGKETRKPSKKQTPAQKETPPPVKETPPASETDLDEADEDDRYAPADEYEEDDDPEENGEDLTEEEDDGRWGSGSDEDEDEDDGDDDQESTEPRIPVTQEAIDLGLEAVQKMADLITDDARVEAVTDQDRLTLQITGGNAGILIGRKGQTLDAMQFLADKIINRKSEARVRVKVDIEGYMETRKANLRQLAFKMAEKAKKTGRPATINQMSAQDRRIVHLALKDDSQVRTQSMGDGYYRRLVIFPKKRTSFRGKRRFKRADK